jgi:hypothetical protein
MVRSLVLIFAALALSTTPLAAAEARAHKPAPASSHGKKPAAKTAQAKGGKGRHGHASADEAPSKHGKGKKGHAVADEGGSDSGCAPAKHGRHGRKASHGCEVAHAGKGKKGSHADASDEGGSDEGCAPVKHSRHGHGRKARGCELARSGGGRHGDGERVICKVVRVAHGRHGHTSARRCVREGPPPPPPLVVAAPGSPADIAKHAGPLPGVAAETNPDLWAARRQAELRPKLQGSDRLTGATLVGATDADLRTTLGTPDLERKEGDGALWTYRLSNCSLMVFLHRTDGGMKVTGTQASPLVRGAQSIDVDACLRAAAAR